MSDFIIIGVSLVIFVTGIIVGWCARVSCENTTDNYAQALDELDHLYEGPR